MPKKSEWYSFNNVVKLAPEYSGVYELGYKSNGLVVYIGSSKGSIRSRLLDHIEKHKFVGVTHFRFNKISPENARHTERIMLLAYRKQHGKLPLHNKVIPPEEDNRGDARFGIDM